MKQPVAAEIEADTLTVQSAEEEFIIQSTTNELLVLMAKLEEVDRDIFTMKYFLNMQNQEIATKLGLTKAAVDNRLYRGKKRMQKYRVEGAYT